jgi:hypothetical protein
MDAFGTLSSGYDSPAVAVLTRSLSIESYFSASKTATLIPRWLDRNAAEDDGSEIGALLEVPVQRIAPLGSGEIDETELYFLAVSTIEPETAFHPLSAALSLRERPAVVFTGYQGDKVWDRSPAPEFLTDEIAGGGSSGLNLGEIRLAAGFVHVAVPFIHARSIRSIHRISKSAEMKEWTLGSGYDRPIARRLIEEAGVPRDLFANRKKAVIDWYREPYNPSLREDFRRWIESRLGIPRTRLVLSNRICTVASIPLAVIDRLRRWITQSGDRGVSRLPGVDLWPERWLFVWSANRLAESCEEALDV